MKKTTLALFAVVALGASSFAGTTVTSGKDFKAPAPVTCFNDNEFQLDVFGSYTAGGDYKDGFGGGLGATYFFTRNLGFGVDGNVYDGGANGRWTVSGNLVVRFPIDSICLAPYILAGGGAGFDGVTEGIVNVGGGVEYRVIPHVMGLFAEGRYVWAGQTDGAGQARLGVRFAF